MEKNPSRNIEQKEYEKFIPLDKYWIIRMGILDLLNGHTEDIKTFLSTQKDLSGDLLALQRAVNTWDTGEPIDVGESGTIYRILQFASWKLGLNKKFIYGGTLTKRIKDGYVTQNPDIVNFSLDELAKLDKGTTQWATAAILLGNKEDLTKRKYFNDVTYEALEYWNKVREKNETWLPRQDPVLMRQAEYFLALLKREKATFEPLNPDDYCFARAFKLISREEGEKAWPEAEGHESKRFEEMEKAIAKAEKGERVNSKDHRVVQAIAMWEVVKRRRVKFKYPEAVNKSWPLFWEFLKSVA